MVNRLIWEISLTCSMSLFPIFVLYQFTENFLLILLICYGIAFLIYRLQDLLLYQHSEPNGSRLIVETPAQFDLPYETLIIPTVDHEKLHGYLIKQAVAADQCETLIFFHGNAGNIGHRLQNALLLYRNCQINLVLFDYRGYGKSTGQSSETGLYLDAEAVYDYISQRADLNSEKIFLFGRSLGGAVAIHLASILSQTDTNPPLFCVILENTFTSIPAMAKQIFKVSLIDYIPHWCYKNLFLSDLKIRHITVPTLFISGGQDELVPPQMMQTLFQECRSSLKKMLVFADGQHNTTWFSRGYSNRIRDYLNDCAANV